MILTHASHAYSNIVTTLIFEPSLIAYSNFVTLKLNIIPSFSGGEISSQLGVNYERLGNNLLPPRTSMSFLQSSLKAKRVKIYDADAEILDALRNMGIRVSIMLPNQLVINVSTNQTFLDEWVQSNVVPFHPETLIRYLNSLVPQVWNYFLL